jgi:parallel beta-helix repeat protein
MQDHDSTSSNLPTALPTDRRALLAGLGGLAAGALLAGKAHAGPLTPPPGPLTPTPGPEPRIAIDQINTPGDANHTFCITQPGSYYFPGNLFGQPQKSGILIASSDVTIDMMGFRLQPINVESGTGIVSSGERVNITIRNGVVTKWQNGGINLSPGFLEVPCNGIRIEGVTVTENLVRGIRAGSNTIVQNCIVRANEGSGISVRHGCIVSACTAFENTGTGIIAGDGSTITNCSSYANTGHGIATGSSTTVSGITACRNGESGIFAGSSSTISHSTFSLNSQSGILVTFASIVLANTCHSNGNGSGDGAGILATGSDNRIEGNNCRGADRGIDVNGTGNIIIRNTCSGNTVNWDIVAGNSYLIVQAPTTASNFTGDAGGSGVGSTNPHANFTF